MAQPKEGVQVSGPPLETNWRVARLLMSDATQQNQEGVKNLVKDGKASSGKETVLLNNKNKGKAKNGGKR
jgi:hypothetical protein